MSNPVVSITKRDGRDVVVFKRDGIVEGWAYLDELSEETRAGILRTLETSDLGKVDVNEMAGQLRDGAAWAQKNKEAALDQPYRLFFFSAIDRDGVTRFFDAMKQIEGFTLAETAIDAPMLGQCIETVYPGPGGEKHHVHRNYGRFHTDTARHVMHDFAVLTGLTQVTELGETFNLREAQPIWRLVFKKLCSSTVAADPASQEDKAQLNDQLPADPTTDEREKHKEIFKVIMDARDECQATRGSREELEAMMLAAWEEIKVRKERGEINTREEEIREMAKCTAHIRLLREYERGRRMAARHQPPGPEAAYKNGDIIGGKYEVGGMLGTGGFGEVYLIYDRRTLELSAVKTFRQKFLANAAARENFKREALLWVNLGDHPFVVAARVVEEFNGRLFVNMDYIAPDDEGRVSLAAHLTSARGPVNTERALEWAVMFCYGMEHANQRGITSHRDIKPANILIRYDGTLLISDFGLAAAAEAAWKASADSLDSAEEESFVGLSLFQTGGKRVCGTPGYIAPEVFRGEGADVRSDIYSFGLVLWQMATGNELPPFAVGVEPPRSAHDTGRYALEIYQRQITERAPAVGDPFEAVIGRCLTSEPSNRFGSFAELRAELEPVLYRRTGQTLKMPHIDERPAAIWNNKGLSLFSLGRFEEAAACFQKSVRINSDDSTVHSNLGCALKAKGDLDGAISEYRAAIRLRADDASAHVNLGTALTEKGLTDEAITECRTAVGLQPGLAMAHNNLGKALAEKGNLDEAITEYRRAIHLQPDLAMTHYNLGVALSDKDCLDEAIIEYRAATRLQPDLALAHWNLGVVLWATGDSEPALKEFKAAYALAPNEPAIREPYENLMRQLR